MTDRSAISSTTQRRAETECLANGETNSAPCWICGLPINYALRRQHRATAAVHHLTDPVLGGDPTTQPT